MSEYRVEEFGARKDGTVKCTKAIQEAIDRCHKEGGGSACLSKGVYITGTLYLKSGVFLEIGSGAVLLASPDIEDYGQDTHHNRYRNEPEQDRCLIFAEDAENIGLIVQNISMCNVSRPVFLLLNNRFEPEGLGRSMELGQMPEIGRMEKDEREPFLIENCQELKRGIFVVKAAIG